MNLDQINLETRIGTRTVRELLIVGEPINRIAAKLQMEGARAEHAEVASRVDELHSWHAHSAPAAAA